MTITNEQLKDFIAGIEDIEDVSTTFSILIYGQNGTGKTRTASTFPKPLLLADIREKGTDSIKTVKGIKRRKIERWEDVELLYWFLKTQNSKLKTPFRTLVLDTVTQLEQLALAYVMNKEAKSFGFEIDSKSDMDMPKIRDYGNAASLMKAWMIRFRDLVDDDIYVAFNVQEKRDGSEEVDEDKHEVFPQLMQSIRSILGGAATHIIHTEIREVTKTIQGQIKSIPVYVARLGPSSKYLTKFRVPPGVKVPQFIVNPGYEQIKDLMEGKIKEKEIKEENKEEEVDE